VKWRCLDVWLPRVGKTSHAFAEDGVMTADGGSVFCVHLARLAELREVLVASKDGAAEPDRVALYDVLEDVASHGVLSTRDLVERYHALVENILHLRLESCVKALEQRRTT